MCTEACGIFALTLDELIYCVVIFCVSIKMIIICNQQKQTNEQNGIPVFAQTPDTGFRVV
jgi:hypothetical protein